MSRLTHVDLFSGIGGFGLAAAWAGFETVGFCEIDPFCRGVLAKHWPEAPIHGDVRTLGGDDVRQWIAEAEQRLRVEGASSADSAPVLGAALKRGEPDRIADERGATGSGASADGGWAADDADERHVGSCSAIRAGRHGLGNASEATSVADAERRDGRADNQRRRSPRRGRAAAGSDGPTLFTGGFPCQPWSLAGKRLGEKDDRHLGPEMLRLVAELRPRWVVGENVVGFVGLGLDGMLAELENLGYAWWAAIIPAVAVDAPHRRDRIWIVAHAEDGGARRGAIPWQARLFALAGEDAAFAHGESESIVAGDGDKGRGFVGPGFVADAEGERGGASGEALDRARRADGVGGIGEHAADSFGDGLSDGRESGDDGGAKRQLAVAGRGGSEHEALGGLGGADDGLPGRLARLMDPRWGGDPMGAFGPHWEDGVPRTTAHEDKRVPKLKALGNAIVPQVAYAILSVIADLERET